MINQISNLKNQNHKSKIKSYPLTLILSRKGRGNGEREK